MRERRTKQNVSGGNKVILQASAGVGEFVFEKDK